jgi:hypothetical protein
MFHVVPSENQKLLSFPAKSEVPKKFAGMSKYGIFALYNKVNRRILF